MLATFSEAVRFGRSSNAQKIAAPSLFNRVRRPGEFPKVLNIDRWLPIRDQTGDYEDRPARDGTSASLPKSATIHKEKQMDWEQVESKWKQLISSAKENWSKLTDDDLHKISGKREQLAGKIQEIYGVTRREAEKQVWDWGKTVERASKKIA